MLWFESLLFYGCEEREQERGDVDVALLPTVVEKVLLPKLTGGFRAGHSGTWPLGPAFRAATTARFPTEVTSWTVRSPPGQRRLTGRRESLRRGLKGRLAAGPGLCVLHTVTTAWGMRGRGENLSEDQKSRMQEPT